MVGQRLGGSVFARGDQVPDEALDVLVSTVVQQAVGQERSADGLHVGLLQRPLEATVGQDVAPPSPPGGEHVAQTPLVNDQRRFGQFTSVRNDKCDFPSTPQGGVSTSC